MLLDPIKLKQLFSIQLQIKSDQILISQMIRSKRARGFEIISVNRNKYIK